MGFGTASTLLKITLILSILAFLFHIIGFATNAWVTNAFGLTSGLWKACGTRCVSMSAKSDEFRAVRALETIGLILLFGLVVGILVFVFLDGMRKSIIRTLLIVASMLAVACIIVGVIIFGANMTYMTPLLSPDASYSLALCVVGAGLALATGILLVLDSRSGY